ncbi:MAG: hypothetical protein Fur006_33840 [Coleofasciculaceae cyanobacterium]
MTKPIQILLQTTIPTTEDDWSIERFSLLRNYLASLNDEAGKPLCEVTARDRKPDAEGNDPVLSQLDRSDFDELWLFAVDVGDGLTEKDCAGITAFHQRGGGILVTRDHQDLGCSVCQLENIGLYHFFQTHNPDPDESRRCIDDIYTKTISWPNYHSGRNGDYQKITPVDPIHELLKNPTSPSGYIEFFPAHPHEGAVGVSPNDGNARVIAAGTSLVSGRSFNLAVAIDRVKDAQGNVLGRVVAESTFHHFCDYNWDARMGCPSFVDEPPGDTMQREPRALEDLKAYIRNITFWLTPSTVVSNS